MARSRWQLLIVCFVVGGLVAGSASGVVQSQGDGSVSGVAMPLSPSQEADALASMEEMVDGLSGVSVRAHAMVVVSSDGTWWMVYTDQEPQAGKAVVEGRVFRPRDLGSETRGIVFADRVSFSRDGARISMSELESNPGRYAGELVSVTTRYKQLSFATEHGSSSRVSFSTWGALQAMPVPLIERPGVAGRWTTLNLSSAEYGASRNRELGTRLWGVNLTQSVGGQRYWIDAKTRVTIGVVPTGGGYLYYLVDTAIPAQSVPGPRTIAKNGEQLNGSVVSTSGQLVGARISTQESLLAAARCAPMSVTNPVTGCLPIPTDATIHVGVLFEGVPDDPRAFVFYYALSNHHQQQAVTLESGTYDVTGRVRSTDQLSPQLPSGYALEAYDLERTGSLTASEAAREAASRYRSDAQQVIEYQLKEGHANETTPDSQAAATTTQSQTNPPSTSTTTSTVDVVTQVDQRNGGPVIPVSGSRPLAVLAGLAGLLFLLSAIGLESYRGVIRFSGVEPPFTIHHAVLCVGLACVSLGAATAFLDAVRLGGWLASLGTAILIVTTLHRRGLHVPTLDTNAGSVLLDHPYTRVGIATLLLTGLGLLITASSVYGTLFIGLGILCWGMFILAIPLRLLKSRWQGPDAVNTTETDINALFLAGGSSFALNSVYTGDTMVGIGILTALWGVFAIAHLLGDLLETLWHHI